MPTAKLAALRDSLARLERVVIGFSGGVDSAFLLKVASDVLGDRCHAVTAVSVTMARSEVADAEALGAELGLGARHHVIESNELERPGFAENPTNRCAMCKTELMEIAGPLASQLGAVVVIGTNVDDLGDFRPGIAAAKDHGAHMPMVEAGLTKAEIRELSRQLGLRTWDKPQLACLSSRFPYGTKITPERLRRVDAFEDGLRALGFRELRVRFHEDASAPNGGDGGGTTRDLPAIARLELPVAELPRAASPGVREGIVELGKRLGFAYVALDLVGFRSGSLNETLRAPSSQPLIALRRRLS
jgi:pyridinium-3,5-biscarboxylic acid mononucleotide sulfurtransferase